MATAQQHPYISEAEYLALDAKSDIRYEYANGRIYAMAGANRPHNVICTNITRIYGTPIVKNGCEIYQGDMRVKIQIGKASYRYPDLVVVCGEPEFDDNEATKLDTLLNPALIIEVLSPSTAKIDLSDKLKEYSQIESLQDYLVISPDEPQIHHYRRVKEGWGVMTYTGLDSKIVLQSLSLTFSLQAIYELIKFSNNTLGN